MNPGWDLKNDALGLRRVCKAEENIENTSLCRGKPRTANDAALDSSRARIVALIIETDKQGEN